MVETGGQTAEPARLRNEQLRPEGRVKRLARRVTSFFRRKIPDAPALVNPEGMISAARAEGGPSHAERVGKEGCLYRALISASGFALNTLGRKHLPTEEGAKGKEWAIAIEKTKNIIAKLRQRHVVPTKEEHEMRFTLIDQGAKELSELNQDVLSLVDKLRRPPQPTDLSEMLNAVTLSTPQMVNSKEEIFSLMDKGEQVMVFTSDTDPNLSHIFHAGRRGRKLISQSDGKKNQRFREAKLNKPPYTVFTVSPRLVAETINPVSEHQETSSGASVRQLPLRRQQAPVPQSEREAA